MHFVEFIGRVFLSSLFLVEGIKKLFFFQEETQIYMEEYGIPEFLFFPSTILEIIFPILIIIGFNIRNKSRKYAYLIKSYNYKFSTTIANN